jgi:hypothetical protein
VLPSFSEMKNKPSKKPTCTCFALVSCPAYSTLKMEVIRSSETSVDFQRTTQRYIPEDRTLFVTTPVRTSNATVSTYAFCIILPYESVLPHSMRSVFMKIEITLQLFIRTSNIKSHVHCSWNIQGQCITLRGGSEAFILISKWVVSQR